MRKERTRSGTPGITPAMQSASAAVRTARRLPKERKRLCSPLVTAIACADPKHRREERMCPPTSRNHTRWHIPTIPPGWLTRSASYASHPPYSLSTSESPADPAPGITLPMELRIGCPPASSRRLQNQGKRPAKAFMQPMLLQFRSVVMRKTTGIPAMHVRKVRGAHAPCGLTLAPLLLANFPYPVAIPPRSRWLFGGCHAFMPKETQKPRQPSGYGVSCRLQREQATSPPPLRRLFNPALYRRPHAACKTREQASRPRR